MHAVRRASVHAGGACGGTWRRMRRRLGVRVGVGGLQSRPSGSRCVPRGGARRRHERLPVRREGDAERGALLCGRDQRSASVAAAVATATIAATTAAAAVAAAAIAAAAIAAAAVAAAAAAAAAARACE